MNTNTTDPVRAALEWYAEQVAGCRKLGSIGDPFRHALDADGGKRAQAALAQQPSTHANTTDPVRVTHQMVLAANTKVPVIAGRPVLTYCQVRAVLEAALAQQPEAPAQAWRSPDEIPDVVPGGSAYFWVAVRRKHDGRVYSFPAQYLNAMLLFNEWGAETERSGNRYNHGPTDEDEGNFPATGWHFEKEHSEYDGLYSPLLEATDELVAWREVANYPGTEAQLPAIPEGWPKASASCAQSGWTLDYGFVSRIQKRVEEEEEDWVSLELVETIMRVGLEVYRLQFAAQPSREGE